jgi:hypothetical protein
MAGTVEPIEGKSRRDLLKALGAAAAGAVAGGVLKVDKAQADHGTLNATSDTDIPAIHGDNTWSDVRGGPGVVGTSAEGIGVIGTSSGMWGTGVVADGGEGFGLRASGGQIGAMIQGTEIGMTVSGHEGIQASGRQYAVLASTSASGTGVHGENVAATLGGIGVLGDAGGSGVGVKAKALNQTATALQVEGKAQFSTAGSGTIAASQDSASVTNAIVTALSHITVTLTGDPGQASSAPGSKPAVVWVERHPGNGFVVHMSRPVRFATPFTYLVVEPI